MVVAEVVIEFRLVSGWRGRQRSQFQTFPFGHQAFRRFRAGYDVFQGLNLELRCP